MSEVNGGHQDDAEVLTRKPSEDDGAVVESPTKTSSKKTFTVYPRRWAVLITVVLLNISNASLWICISPVATKVADYFHRDLSDINWFSLVYLFISIPFCFISTFIVNRLGLKPTIHIGAALNCIGGVIRALSSSGLFPDLDAQFAICLTGQVSAGMAQAFMLFIPTKVSQQWFPESARAISTTMLALSNPLGVVVAMIATPLLVNTKDDFPILNWVFGGLAVAVEIVTIFCVTSSQPPTPPSASAEEDNTEERAPYLQQLKDTFTCIPFWLLFLALGAGIGLFSALATVTQQVLCPLGYSDEFAGLVNAVMILCGFVGSAVTGVMADRTKEFTPITKYCYGLATLMAIVMFEMFMIPDQEALIATFTGLFGLFGVGAYPIGLELAVEATYPVDQSISNAFLFLSGQLQGVIIIAMVGGLSREQKAKYVDIQVCTESEISQIEPKDYTVSILGTMTLLTTVVVLTIIFLKTPYKRLEAERAAMEASSDGPSTSIPPSPSHSLNEGVPGGNGPLRRTSSRSSKGSISDKEDTDRKDSMAQSNM